MAVFWNNLPIRSKLLLSIAAILTIFIVSLSVDYVFIARESAAISESIKRTEPTLNAIARARLQTSTLVVHALRYHILRDRQLAKTGLQKYGASIQDVYTQLRVIRALGTPEEQQSVDDFTRWFDTFHASKERSFQLRDSGHVAEGAAESARMLITTGDDILRTLGENVGRRYQLASDAVLAGAAMAQAITILAGIASALLGLVLALLLGRSISRRLEAVTSAMGHIINDEVGALVASMKLLATGDLRARVVSRSEPLEVSGEDEAARLAKAYNSLLLGIKEISGEFTSTTELLSELITKIKGAAEQVNLAATEIAEGNTNLSQRTEEQASGLEETASSMEEFTATVKQNSDSAQEANTLGGAAATNARKGGESMNEVVATMNDINASSHKIVEIISVIDGIAFQTNILALNAAVEAARAGEQGRGFAVVAGEVRSLAQRSAAAAKEIKELIDDTVAKVTTGSGQVEAAGSTMQDLVTSVQRVTDIVSDIAAASREQSSGIDQVNKAIAQMDEVTQQNSALVEEAAAAAGALEEQARTLLDTVSTFKVDAAPAGGAPPPSRSGPTVSPPAVRQLAQLTA